MTQGDTDVTFDPQEAGIFDTPFDQLPPTMRTRAFGVDYAHLTLPGRGDLYVTRFGWTVGRPLLPANWYVDQYYSKQGRRLPDSTGHVYHVQTRPCLGREAEIVVKFSRVGQEVPLEIATSFPDDVSHEDIAAARFNSPMEEFGLLMELRAAKINERSGGRMLTQEPLAIYVPPQEFDLWRLGRSQSRFHSHQRRLEQDQEQKEAAMALDIRRDYVMVFQWVKGINASQALRAGDISQQTFAALMPRAIDELRAAGFRVLDNKPSHLIVRPRRNGKGMVQRNGKVSYALVDFELLQQTEAHHQRFKLAQREKYMQLLNDPTAGKEKPLPPGLQRVNILGVDYVYGATPNGGMLWTVGNDPALFEFFLPDRWRRTPRIRMALTREVCRTRTRDNIHVVYRQSRVGERPHVDPFYASGKRIREFGYNSPFEEIAVAEALRRAGMTTIHPRAIYRTGTQSIKAGYLLDDRRYELYREVRTPEREQVLSPRHDYYLIWGLWRGVDPQGSAGFVDLRKAREDELISPEQHERVLGDLQHRLIANGFLDSSREDDEYLLLLDRHGQLLRDERGWFEIAFSADALTVFDYGLISEATYRDLIHRAEAQIRSAGCEALDLSGNHLLLSLDGDGRPRTDARGEPLVALCNFELIRMNSLKMDTKTE